MFSPHAGETGESSTVERRWGRGGRETQTERQRQKGQVGGKDGRYIYKLVCCPPLVNYVEERGVTTLIG